MNEQNPAERFSAYHDGESADSESELLRQELQTSPDARLELADYAQISHLLNELPKARLGSEFPASVMQAVERAMLIPAAEELSVVRRQPSTRNRWLPAVAAFCASAAVLFFAVKLLDKPAGLRPELTVETESVRVSGTKVGGRSSLDSHLARAPVEESGRTVEKMTESPAAAVPAPPSTESVARSSPADAPSVASTAKNDDDFRSNSAGEAQPSLSNTILVNSPSHLEFNEDLQEAEVGQMVEALDRSGDKISVVRLTVVDRVAGLEQLQLLLLDQSIPVAASDFDMALKANEKKIAKAGAKSNSGQSDGAANQPNDEKPAPEPNGSKMGDELICVLVNADSQQLSAALWQLKHGGEFQDLRVEDPPITVAELSDYVPAVGFRTEQQQDKGESKTAADEAKDSNGNDASQPQDESPTRSKSLKESSEVADSKFDRAQKAEQKPKPESLAMVRQQVKLSIPTRVFGRSASPQLPVPRDADADKPAQSPERRQIASQDVRQLDKVKERSAPRSAAESKTQSRPSSPPHPVQVLLVLEEGVGIKANSAPAAPVEPAPQ